jgi:phenylpyruvate tautomerase PptA (4-oxalocrotonate tautomerase family)
VNKLKKHLALSKEKITITKMENYYLRKQRNMIYIALEDVEDTDFFWSRKEIRKFDLLWEENMPIAEIAKEMHRTEISVLLLSFDRLLKGNIEPRERWHIW